MEIKNTSMQQDTPHLNVAYLGPPASFSHQAALEAFPDSTSVTLHPLPSFESIFSAIQKSSTLSPDTPFSTDDPKYDYALIPIENSTNGSVIPVLDLLTQCGLDPTSALYPDIEVVAEHYLEVHHCLLIHPAVLKKVQEDQPDLTDDALLHALNITTLYTHPQVWGQCARYLSKHLPTSKTERIDMSSTSAAAVYVSQHSIPRDKDSTPEDHKSTAQSSTPAKQGNIAAISSSLAQSQTKLSLLASNIEDEPGQNTTRFLIIRHRTPSSSKSTSTSTSVTQLPPSLGLSLLSLPGHLQLYHKSLIIFTLPYNQAGALASALAVFATHGFNLTAISTRPSRERNWHYVFFVRCEEQRTVKSGVMGGGNLDGMLRELRGVTERTCLLGSWLDGNRYPG